MNDLISVIVPVYNVEKYLERCLDSIINQTYKNIEIICVNDGSQDNSQKILNKYFEKDKRIKIIQKSNGGLSDARNYGIDKAIGKYITFIDSDDLITEDYIEYLYNLIKKYKTKISICDRAVVWKNLDKVKEDIKKENSIEEKLNTEQTFRNMLLEQGIDVCAYAKLYDMDLWKDIRYPVGKVYEDTATTYKIIDKTDYIAYGNKKCYFYIARADSISKHKTFDNREYDYINFTNEMLNCLNNKYPNLNLPIKRFYLYSKFRIYRMIMYCKPRKKEMEEEYISEIKKYKSEVLKYAETPKRDKMAIILISVNKYLFKIMWSFYCKITGRI